MPSHYERGFLACVLFFAICSAATMAQDSAEAILDATGVQGGLVVHIGCGSGELTADLRANDRYRVHGLDRDAESVKKARAAIRERGLYGPVSVDRLEGEHLPYVNDLVNLLVVEDGSGLAEGETMRVLAPLGVAYVKKDGRWTKVEKPWPEEIDEWPHYLHDSTNNAVAHDERIGPLTRMQWTGGPRWARHHDHMSSMSSLVSAKGRLFYIFDEGSTSSIMLPSRWKLIGRDAFNGTMLWKVPIERWHTRLWPLKSGPALLTRRLVAEGDTVFTTLGIHAPLSTVDAATGKIIKTYAGTEGTEEIVCRDGVVYLIINPAPQKTWLTHQSIIDVRKDVRGPQWGGGEKIVAALNPESGEIIWKRQSFVAPSTLAVDGERAYYHNGERIIAVDRENGAEVWQSDPMPIWAQFQSWFVPCLVVYEDVVLWVGGENMIPHRSGKDTMYAIDSVTGKTLWSAPHGPSGYQSAEDLLVAGGLVWTGATTNGTYDGVFRGYDPRTGELKKEFAPDVDSYWFHHRCYRGKATDKYLLMSRTGIEFIDIANEHWNLHHWVRGACVTGVLPCNGMIYAAPHDCACYAEAKLTGFSAVAAPSASLDAVRAAEADSPRLKRGSAFGCVEESDVTADDAQWPTYRHDGSRCGSTPMRLPAEVRPKWETELGGELSALTVARGKAFLARLDDHSVRALDLETGKPVWSRTVGGPVDSPPTIWKDLCLFGSADGHVYCLKADTGEPVWRFRAAPVDQRQLSYENVESVWPVHGSVLVQDDVVYAVAGRAMFLDGGLNLYRLNPRTGDVISHRHYDDRDPESGESLQMRHQVLQMPVGLPDVLASDGKHVYMRSQVMDMEGKRLELGPNVGDPVLQATTQRGDTAHLFAPYGFLDGSWFHRSYWVFGRSFSAGWNGYYQAGKFTPSGRILVADSNRVYGYGRKPRYLRWTTPMEYHLFACDRTPPELKDVQPWRHTRSRARGGSMVTVENSGSLDPTDKPLAVEAWVKSEKPGGVVVSRGGPAHGYALYLREGRPHFAVRVAGKRFVVSGTQKVTGEWTYLAGVLRKDKQLELYVDGKPAASTQIAGLIPEDPAQAMEIGVDLGGGTGVGDFNSPFAFTGLIDEVRVYHGPVTAEEIARHAAKPGETAAAGAKLVLHYTFDKGKAQDRSGNKNHGQVSNVQRVKSPRNGAIRLSGKGPAKKSKEHFVEYLWSHEAPPMIARAMALAGDTLFVAGPEDLVNEDAALGNIVDPNLQAKLAAQDEALLGKRGALLLAVSAENGTVLAQHSLDAVPRWDGMLAAEGRLLFSTTDGRVVCFGK